MRERSLPLLTSPAFLLAVTLLLVNDFLLKPQFHNAVTGKLSDFAGLFAFAMFWSAIFPRFRAQVVILTAAAFFFWKSPYAQPLIDGWNVHAPFAVARTVDATDLFALLVLPLAYVYVTRVRPRRAPRPLIYAIAVVSLFAFTATQFRHRIAFNTEYVLPMSKRNLVNRMKWMPEHKSLELTAENDTFEILFDDCNGTAWIGLAEANGQTKLRLWLMDYRCPGRPDPAGMQEFFERNFIDLIDQTEFPKTKKKISYIWRVPPGGIPAPTHTGTLKETQ